DPITSITINFTPCDPEPAEGYNILYRVVGATDYIDAGFFISSPAIISVSASPETKFEGVLRSSCGDVFWTTVTEPPPPPPVGGGCETVLADNGLSNVDGCHVVLGGDVGTPSNLISDRYINTDVYTLHLDAPGGG